MKNPLKNIALIFVFVGLVSALISCGKDDKKEVEPSNDIKEMLVMRQWKMVEVTEVNGASISRNKLDGMTQYLFGLNFAFAANNTVKAIDNASSQVMNGGTWYLSNENKILDIDVSGFKGEFILKSITPSKMSLQNKLVIGGEEQDGVLVFEPIVQ